jgi:hypothetical protein
MGLTTWRVECNDDTGIKEAGYEDVDWIKLARDRFQ